MNRKTKSFLNKIWKMFAEKWKLTETEGKENFLKGEIKIDSIFLYLLSCLKVITFTLAGLC